MTFNLSIETPAEKARKSKKKTSKMMLAWRESPDGSLWMPTGGCIYRIEKEICADGSHMWSLKCITASGATIWTRRYVWKMEAKKAAAEDSAAWEQVHSNVVDRMTADGR